MAKTISEEQRKKISESMKGRKLSEDSTIKIYTPEKSEWVCYLFGNTPENNFGLKWTPKKGCEPNWFWRKMQWLIFGNYWVEEK
ncbi:MAG: hypothetical protein H8E03_01340 [Pelagibacteraceae bacterium]|nr:hypothetical protein [Pelagibacteraceae bacterium]